MFIEHKVFANDEVNLDCNMVNQKFEINLNYKKSLFKVSTQDLPHHMIYSDNIIKTSAPGSGITTHYLWELSRITGRGKVKAFNLPEEELTSVKQSYITEILLSKVGNLEDKSLDAKRNEIINNYLIPFLETKKPKQILDFECKKVEKKF